MSFMAAELICKKVCETLILMRLIREQERRGMTMRRLPIGVDDFREIIESGYYYVDKTDFIRNLIDNGSKVSVFTRPRRFGKSLALSMLKYYFENEMGIDEEKSDNRKLFEGLKIMEAGENYLKYQGQYPVIFLSFKSAKQPDFDMAYGSIVDEIAKEFRRHNGILESDRLLEEEKERYVRLRSRKGSALEYAKALDFLCGCMRRVYGRRVIILLDEYDVPLENAWLRGFYESMSDFIRSLLESALKTNGNLEFSVITGCLRISKESIFTGLNNLDIISILNGNYAESFGFTAAEAEKMLEDFGISERKQEVRKWYDGYRFGDTEVYNPWSLINYVKAAAGGISEWPKAYWANTSSNDIVKKLVERADSMVRQELEILLAGGTIEKPIHEDITYEEIYRTQDNLWNFLFFTGYLKKTKARFEVDTTYLTMAVPNAEVLYIYKNTVMDWTDSHMKQKDLSALYQALVERDVEAVEKELSVNLMETISFYDYKEDYYHGFTAGLLKSSDGYLVKSNRESGLGRSDLLMLAPAYEGIAIIIEVKVADTYAGLEKTAKKALAQIEARQYDAELKLEGYHTFIKYGFAFYKKLCRVECAANQREERKIY